MTAHRRNAFGGSIAAVACSWWFMIISSIAITISWGAVKGILVPNTNHQTELLSSTDPESHLSQDLHSWLVILENPPGTTRDLVLRTHTPKSTSSLGSSHPCHAKQPISIFRSLDLSKVHGLPSSCIKYTGMADFRTSEDAMF